MPMCQAYGCTNRNGSLTTGGEKRTFFSIPDPKKNRELCGKWIHSLCTVKFKLRTYTYSRSRVVCEDHFTPDCFQEDKQAKTLGYKPFRKQLKVDAVPNVNVHLPKKKVTLKRRSTAIEKREEQAKLQTVPVTEATRSVRDDQGSIPAKTPVKRHRGKFVALSSPKKQRKLHKRRSTTCSSVGVQTDEKSIQSTECQTEVDASDFEMQWPPVQQTVADMGTKWDHIYCQRDDTPKPQTIILIEPTNTVLDVEEEGEEEMDTIFLPDCDSVAQVVSISTAPGEGGDHGQNSDDEGSSCAKEEEDIDYTPDKSSGSSTSDSAHEGHVEQKKYVVFEESIKSLIYQLKCFKCGGPVEDIASCTKGTMLKMELTCMQGHLFYSWRSQPIIQGTPVGNVLSSAAILFSGGTFQSTKRMFDFMGIEFISESTFHQHQRSFLFPVVNSYYEREIENALQDVCKESQQITVSGDARCDSPGYSAKYSTYTMMDASTNKILHTQLVQVTEATSSVGMEKVGFGRSLDHLLEKKVPIKIVATDRHPSIRKMMKDKYPEIMHEFDIWHLSKGLKKKLLEKSKQKGCSDLALWIRAICNHLWWCAANCGGDALLLKEMWTSISHHISNQHSWVNAEKYKQCDHPPIPEDRDDEKVWLEAGSLAHEALQQVVLSKLLLKDLTQVVHCCHTGQLEMYHSTMLKYCPKRLHFSYAGMRARTQLAVLDHNKNLHRKQAIVSRPQKGSSEKGEGQYKVVFPKGSKEWVAKPVYEQKSYSYVGDMLGEVLDLLKQRHLPIVTTPELPSNISRTDRPPKKNIIEKHKTRFQTSD